MMQFSGIIGSSVLLLVTTASQVYFPRVLLKERRVSKCILDIRFEANVELMSNACLPMASKFP